MTGVGRRLRRLVQLVVPGLPGSAGDTAERGHGDGHAGEQAGGEGVVGQRPSGAGSDRLGSSWMVVVMTPGMQGCTDADPVDGLGER